MIFRRRKFIFSLIIFLVLVLYQRFGPSEEVLSEQVINTSPTATFWQSIKQQAQVLRVIDGDTIEVLLNEKKEKIRVIGINTPEVVDPRKAVECFGKEASSFAKQILEGQTVILESDLSQQERDKYGRLLRYIFVNNIDFGKRMIAEGYAYEYTYDSPYKYQLEYKNAESEASEQKLGLWKNEACTI